MNFFLNSPCKGHSVMWGALLGACRIHGDWTCLSLQQRFFFGLEPGSPGKYVVLANAYGTSGLRDSAAEFRTVIRESRVIKEPCDSRMEIQNGTQFFFKSPKQSPELYKMIRGMTLILKDTDYVPDSSEEKEHFSSEVLSLAKHDYLRDIEAVRLKPLGFLSER